MVARIMAVADIYDALVTDRPYRKGMPREKALFILNEEAGQGKLDKIVVEVLEVLLKGSAGSGAAQMDSGSIPNKRISVPSA
jgi:HD-GYP domain-containing protein (c-di-GMP phosphodiesterase class II)